VSGPSRLGATALVVITVFAVATGAAVAAAARGAGWADRPARLVAQQLAGPALARLTAGDGPLTAPAPRGIPSAALFGGSPTVGALVYATGRDPRICSAAVVDSPTGNLVVTAAHCIDGSRFATNVDYVPDYGGGRAPYGVWPVRAFTVPAGWQKDHDSKLDLAFLTVAAVRGRQVQAVTGGLAIGFDLAYDQRIEAVAYNDHESDPVRCATRSFLADMGQLEFLCNGFFDGTSGAPWIAGYNPRTGTGTLVGVLGGYYDGGVYDWASYSPYLGSALRTVYQQAELRAAAVARAEQAGSPPVPA
jgi:hypothetical protein